MEKVYQFPKIPLIGLPACDRLEVLLKRKNLKYAKAQ